jgi:hypothetical protein
MEQNAYMNQFFRSLSSDLNIIGKMPEDDTKILIRVLSETLDSARCKWAVIQSNIKNKKIAQVVPELLKLNDIVNTGIDAGYSVLIKEQHEDLLDYYEDEIFLTYTFFIDALHDMEIYYTISINFPYHNLIDFAKRKQSINSKLKH